MELWDAYDSNLHQIEGMVLTRGQPLPEGVYHLVCDILVRHTDGMFLLMQRALAKRNGGMWEATAGGSALLGETPLQCARRELQEETGVTGALTEVAREPNPANHSYYVEFFCLTDCAKDSVTLQQGETMAYRWVDAATLSAMRRDCQLTLRMRQYLSQLLGE